MEIIRVHPSGWGFIEKGTNRPFIPWGCNYYDPFTGWAPHLWEEFDPGRVTEQLGHIQSVGGNVIRIFTTVKNVLLDPKKINLTGIKKMESMLSRAEACNLRVIWSGPSLWEGAPDWWREDAPYEAYANPGLITAMQTAWRGIGGAFRGHPALFAYDLHNEPFAPWKRSAILNVKWTVWRKRYAPEAPEKLPAPIEPQNCNWHNDLQRFREYLAVEYVRQMTDAIRSTDDTHLITIGLHQKSAPFDWYPPDPYAAFNPHSLAEYLDYISVHYYPHHNFHPNLYRDPYETAEGFKETLWHARAVCRYVYNIDKPVVLEECGWYGGGSVLIGNREQPLRSEEEQTAWCKGLVEATHNDVCGWLFWPYRDTPTALDPSRFSGLFDATGRVKDWGMAFTRLAPEVISSIPARVKGTQVMPLSWKSLVTEPEQIKPFRTRYVNAFREGQIVDFEVI